MNGFDMGGYLLLFTASCIAFGFFVGSIVFKNDGEDTIKKQAIENSCAQYNPSTGIFEWVEK